MLIVNMKCQIGGHCGKVQKSRDLSLDITDKTRDINMFDILLWEQLYSRWVLEYMILVNHKSCLQGIILKGIATNQF